MVTTDPQKSTGSSLHAGRPAHIALLCMHFYPEMVSTGMHMTELTTALVSSDLRFTVISAQPGHESRSQEAVAEHLNYRGVDIFRLPARGNHRKSILSRLRRSLEFTWRTYRAVAKRRRELDGLMVTTNPPFLGLMAAMANRLMGLDYLLLVYDVYPDAPVRLGMLRAGSPVARAWEASTRWVLRRAKVVVVIGVDMADLIRAKLPPEHHGKLTLIRNWSDEAHVVPVPEDENPFVAENGLAGRFVVQYSGTAGRAHNVEPILDAAELMQGEAVTFQFVGDGAKFADLQKEAARRKLDNVQFLPFQPFERLRYVHSAADLAVVCLDPSMNGISVPSKTYGALAAAKPVLALLSSESEIGRTVLEHECGWVVEDATGITIASAVRAAMSDQAELKRRGDNGLRAFREHFTLAAAARQYRVALERLVRP